MSSTASSGGSFFAYPGLANFDVDWYQQRDYDVPYGHRPGATIKKIGCYLCCCCNELHAFGIHVSPPTLNSWLQQQPDGFGRLVYVNPLAVVRYARAQGVNIGFARNVPLDEALARGMYVQTSVKNGGHWVTIACHSVGAPGEPIKYLMHDPMYSLRGFVYTDQYPGGASTTNTRCFYWKWPISQGAGQGAGGAQTESEVGNSGPSAEPDWGGSSIYATSNTGVTMCLWKNGNLLETAEEEALEDDETGEIVSGGQTLTHSNTAVGSYELRVVGAPGTPYEVELIDYDSQMDFTKTVYSGVIDSTGTYVIPFEHDAEATFYDIGPLADIPLGTRVTFRDGGVTAALPDGFYAQPANGLVPAVFIQTSTTVYRGQEISLVSGTVGERNGKKCVIADQVSVYWSSYGALVPNPLGVTAEKASTTFNLFCKTWGAVTEGNSSGVTLSNTLFIPCNGSQYAVGTLLSALGVEDGNVLYIDGENDIFVLYVPQEGFGGSMQETGLRTPPEPRTSTNDRISWAIEQPDGTKVDLHAEMIVDVSANGFDICETSGLMSDRMRVLGSWDISKWQTVDVSGYILTLPDGNRAISDACVMVYVDAIGRRFEFPMPFKDAFGNVIGGWPWKQEVKRSN
ncbi:MAG: hypothetical protein M1133_07680 [Armatimonadetes bacterium]|nr:hypothetical protein [Armatimonadota bacterium]